MKNIILLSLFVLFLVPANSFAQDMSAREDEIMNKLDKGGLCDLITIDLLDKTGKANYYCPEAKGVETIVNALFPPNIDALKEALNGKCPDGKKAVPFPKGDNGIPKGTYTLKCNGQKIPATGTFLVCYTCEGEPTPAPTPKSEATGCEMGCESEISTPSPMVEPSQENPFYYSGSY